MNKIQEAVKILKSGNWCTGQLHRQDKHCALGALGNVMFTLDQLTERAKDIFETDYPTECMLGEAEYDLLEESKEVKVLAEVLVENYPDFYKEEYPSVISRLQDIVAPSDIVTTFNDKQSTVEPVIAMFEKAAVRMDEYE